MGLYYITKGPNNKYFPSLRRGEKEMKNTGKKDNKNVFENYITLNNIYI